MRVLWFVAGALLLCSTQAVAQDSTKAKPKVKRVTNLISFEEIESVRTELNDAYALVERLRPQYLRIRGTGNLDAATTVEIKVVVDDNPRGNLDVLKQIPVSTIREVRWLSGPDASIKYGTNYSAGAILVYTR